ncbi:MAG: phosphoribosylformylglycinamidine cyclo-ligase [Oligoflexia bacterium]|nr:phosphoribosylformylglycinamidine cyclo-ligase [Oligoflexia bacterium]
MAALDYAQSGVNREAADRLVERIALLAKATLNRRVKAAVGGYASLFELDRKRWLAASTDGVGTKLKLAFRLREHRTVGVDLVAMSVNDILCVGAEPLFFLDYFATGRLDPGVAEQVLEGIVEGCRQSGCALVGGETAEMPEFYAAGEYDLGGFAVGLVEPRRALPSREIRAGDVLVGLGSSGCHSNGYSLLRKLLPEGAEGDARARELLTPTRIYVKAVRKLLERGWVKGLAHITGSGYLNVPRMSERVSYRISLPPRAELPSIYDWVRERSGLPFSELACTFNLGIGMVLVVPARKAEEAVKLARRAGEKAWIIGEVTGKARGRDSSVAISQEGETAVLDYGSDSG